MTYDEYWNGDPLMVRAFYKAHKLKQEMQDAQAWLHGMYVLRALDASVGNMFRKKGTQPSEYPKQPVGTQEADNTQMTDEEEANYAMAYMTNMVMAGENWHK